MDFAVDSSPYGNEIHKIMKTVSFFFALLGSISLNAQNTFGDIIGTLVDASNKPIWSARVTTTDGSAIFQAATDFDGSFRISGVPAGKYTLTYQVDTLTMASKKQIDVAPDGYGDAGTVTFSQLSTVVVEVFSDKLVLTRGVAPEIKMDRKDIAKSSNKFSIKGLVTGMTSDVRAADDGSLVFRGARKNDLIYYIDGVKMGATADVPSAAMGYVMVFSGAIPAKYGDTTGGVIVVETVSYNDLYRQWKNSME